jgi:malonyl-CoA O-methyltransferase
MTIGKVQPGHSLHGALARRYALARKWIFANRVDNAGICRTHNHRVPYPEVTGYYIPTLLAWGEKDLALSFARWLAAVQNPDGSWSDYLGRAPYTFDTGQALKGLLALVDDSPEFEGPVRKGCDWMLGRMEESGRVTTPDKSLWGGQHPIPEAIHLFALAPLAEAGRRWGEPRWTRAVSRALAYYLDQEGLTDFNSLTHFHAYIIEGLVDLGRDERAKKGMEGPAALLDRLGFVPGERDLSWCCSTGLLQYAVVWHKLGDRVRGGRAFDYACGLQNETGGFFGSYGEGADYHPADEIAWAVKFFLDAMWWKTRG